MGLETVLVGINEKGKADVASLISESQKQQTAIIKEAQETARKLKEKSEKDTEGEVERMKRQELSSAELESKKVMLMAQRDLIDEARLAVLQEIGQLSKARREDMLKKLILKARKELPSGNVYCNKQDQEFVSKNSGYAFTSNLDCLGGIVVESQDRATRIDLRFETILDEVWSKNLKMVADILFGSK